jgi:hypothetical protein
MGASFLQMIGQMILQALALQVALSVLRSFGFGGPGIPGIQAHAGGVVGQGSLVDRNPGRTFSEAMSEILGPGRNGSGPRIFDTSWLLKAPRYHNGGIVGLRPNEMAAVLERGEEVLTRSDPRHRYNGGGGVGSSEPSSIKVVLPMDSADMLQHMLADTRGQRVILGHINQNQGAWRAAMGIR